MDPCKICSGRFVPAYRGPIRKGVFGQHVERTIWRCQECGVEYLPPVTADLDEFYRGGAYRQQVGEEADVADYFRRHDHEQFLRLGLFEEVPLRDRVVADIGCGGGSFLDLVRGMAGTTIGVEPMEGYHASLHDRGHLPFPSTRAAAAEWQGRVDLAVCFSVVEHVADPLTFLREIRTLLTPGGRLVLSTPNRRDILMETESPGYKAFFYRLVHTYYFDSKALTFLAGAAGFTACQVRCVHRFNFANFVAWLQAGRPTQNTGLSPLGNGFDAVWRAVLEDRGLADYLYAFLSQE